jgi:hypothetical protein
MPVCGFPTDHGDLSASWLAPSPSDGSSGSAVVRDRAKCAGGVDFPTEPLASEGNAREARLATEQSQDGHRCAMLLTTVD